MVLAGPGTYYVAGPIHLKADIDLHVATGAILKFSSVPADYLKEGLTLTRFEGVELYNYSPLICQSIRVVGWWGGRLVVDWCWIGAGMVGG